tara:strand:+ start:333 stop:770 length:438 start_codon:yes stop_codon:yes gene_type:complete
MKDTYLYFRAVADEDNDDGDGASSGINPTSIAIPTRNITGIGPGSDATVVIKFLSVRNQGPRGGQAGAQNDEIIQDTITLGVNTHRHQGVIDTIIRAMNDVHSDGFIDVCDDVATLFGDSTIDEVRLHSDITGVADTGISVAAAM